MEQRISLVTLGVTDLARERAFYQALGWGGAQQPDDEVCFFQAGGMVFGLWTKLGGHGAPGVELAGRCNSVLGLVDSVKAGVGVAPLPVALGDAESDLVRVIGVVPELTRAWRLLTTQELRRTPRVSAFFDFIVEEIETLRPILTG